jgi:hypothetical protein
MGMDIVLMGVVGTVVMRIRPMPAMVRTKFYLNWAIQILLCMKIGKHGNTVGHYCLPEFEPLTGLPISPHIRR